MTRRSLPGGWARTGPIAVVLSVLVVGLLAYPVDWPGVLERLAALDLRWAARLTGAALLGRGVPHRDPVQGLAAAWAARAREA